LAVVSGLVLLFFCSSSQDEGCTSAPLLDTMRRTGAPRVENARFRRRRYIRRASTDRETKDAKPPQRKRSEMMGLHDVSIRGRGALRPPSPTPGRDGDGDAFHRAVAEKAREEIAALVEAARLAQERVDRAARGSR
jgi:hypothetical protein